MEWIVKSFDQLSPSELYEILRARSEVFVVEQNCPYLDPDGLDFNAKHILAVTGGKLEAYCRLLPRGERFREVTISRVMTVPQARRTGLGRELMKRAMQYVICEMNEKEIRISGQAYLKDFYQGFGFSVCRGPYLEDNIPHYEMYYGT